MVDRILIPLDGSAAAEQILPQAGRLLRRDKAEVVLLRVAETPAEEVSAAVYAQGLARALNDQGIRAVGVVRQGPVARAIVETAVEEKATLIALGTHGRSGPARWLLGSVAEQVLRAAPVPVLLARRQPGPAPVSLASASGLPFRRLLVPFDGSEASLGAVEPAAAFAAAFDADVVVLAVDVPVPLAVGGGRVSSPPAAELAAQGAARFRGKGLRASPRTATGDPARRILETAEAEAVDLIVMATHGRTGLERCLLGSVAELVLRRAEVPLLVLRNPPA